MHVIWWRGERDWKASKWGRRNFKLIFMNYFVNRKWDTLDPLDRTVPCRWDEHQKCLYFSYLPSIRAFHFLTGFPFLRAFPKLRKATTSFAMSVCLSTWNNSVPTGRIWWNFMFETFSKIRRENSISLKPDKNNWYFTWERFRVYDNISLISPQNGTCFKQKE